MTSRSYFGKMISTLGSVVPLAMFFFQKIPLNGKKVVFDSFAKNRFVYKGLSLKDCLASKCSLKNEALSIN